MSGNLRLRDLQMGQTDAKNELINDTPAERKLFCDSFLMPENVRISDFETGRKYFILGLKGTGKTALLRYIDINLQDRGFASSFILFKSDFKEEDKATFKQAANTILTDKNTDDFDGHDFTAIWELYFHRQIVKIVEERGLHLFNTDEAWDRYRNYINASFTEKSEWTKLIPKLKKGFVALEISHIKTQVDFEWDDKIANQIQLPRYVNRANELFKRLVPGRDRLYLFVDELELSYGNSKQYKTDVALIRDLIVAITNLNTISLQRHYGLHIVTAIRSEVLTSVNSLGKEINKPTQDFGVTLKWQLSGGKLFDHPLISILVKRIQASEKSMNLNPSSPDEIMKNYLPEKIQNMDAAEYILRRTWFRPRDIIRMLNLAKDMFGDEDMLSHKVFDGINKEYSTRCWIEQAEELKTTYRDDEIEGIQMLLMGIECPYNIEEIRERSERSRQYYESIDTLLNKHRLGDILSHLYTLGIIGNSGEGQMRFSFRGDQKLLINLPMKLHDSLWNFFAACPRNRAI